MMICRDCHYYSDELVLSKTGLPKSVGKSCAHYNNKRGSFPMARIGGWSCPNYTYRELEKVRNDCYAADLWRGHRGEPEPLDENNAWIEELLK